MLLSGVAVAVSMLFGSISWSVVVSVLLGGIFISMFLFQLICKCFEALSLSYQWLCCGSMLKHVRFGHGLSWWHVVGHDRDSWMV